MIISDEEYLEFIKNGQKYALEILREYFENDDGGGGRMKNKTEIWVKGYMDENGDIIISLGNDGYHRVLKDYVDYGIVECKKN